MRFVVAIVLLVGCGEAVRPFGQIETGGAPGAGGAVSTGGGGGTAEGAGGEAGASTGGMNGTGGSVNTGGAPGTGGAPADPACVGKAEGAECREPACGGPTAVIGTPPATGVYQTQAIYYECRVGKCVVITRDCTGALTCAGGATQACGSKGFCYDPAGRATCACYNGPDQVALCR